MKNLITIGSDPEMVVFKEDRPVCAIPVVDFHGKEDKLVFNEHDTLYYDNALVEGTIKPAEDGEELVHSFRSLYGHSSGYLAEKGAQLMAFASVNFDANELLQFPKALEFGCDPEVDMWENVLCPPPFCDPMSGFRSAGGHIHIGRKDYKTADENSFLMNYESKSHFTRAMDLIVGTALTAIENDPSAPKRKELYGKAGRARFELPYGVEYRTPSNGWTAMPEKVRLVHDLTMFAVDFFGNNATVFDGGKEYPFNTVIDIINSGDQKAAMEIIPSLPHKEFIPRLMELANLKHEPRVAVNYGGF
jgi:hypothetical protein